VTPVKMGQAESRSGNRAPAIFVSVADKGDSGE
jgi:hypothetical protein